MLNSTLKTVRHEITQRYTELLEYMYTSEGCVPFNDRNREMLNKLLSG